MIKTVDDLQIFPGYSQKDVELLMRHENRQAIAEPGFVVDYFGMRIRSSSLWNDARTSLDGKKLGIPIPADFHAEGIEYVGLIKSLGTAKSKYAVLELGAGLGPWCVGGAVLARDQGIRDIRISAVEADPQRFSLLRQHLADNGFEPDQHRLHEAAVGVSDGVVYWPILKDGREDSGARPLNGEFKSDYRGHVYEETRTVKVKSIQSLLCQEEIWDLVHVDVQGAEYEICRPSITEFSKRVRWVVVGTHSRKLDGDIFQLFWENGWHLENEKPSRVVFRSDLPTLEVMTTHDGTQVWRNPKI